MSGLVYDSGDSAALMGALTANLKTGTALLDSLESASARLVGVLNSGALSGNGYAAVDALFSQVIVPCLGDAKNEIEAISGELTTYAWEDSKVSRFGVLNEDELKKQLVATQKQRDATAHQIEVNTHAANSSSTVPGLSTALLARNDQLQMVLAQLDTDLRDLEDRINALTAFAARTVMLFDESLAKLGTATRDTVLLLNQLLKPGGGLSTWVGGTGTALGATATRAKILDFLAGTKLSRDTEGRVRWGDRYLFDRTDDFIFRRGKSYNAATGTRIDDYRKFVKSGAKGLAAPVEDFRGWKDVSKLGKFGKGFGAAGTLLTVGLDVNEHFGAGGDGNAGKFAVDVGVDLAGAAAAAGVGAAAGSFVLPPLGTVIGAGVGIAANFILNLPWVGGKSVLDTAKDGLKNLFGL